MATHAKTAKSKPESIPAGAVAVMERPEPAPGGLSPSERRHLGSLERRIGDGLQTFREVGAALLEIRDTRLYRETHSSFEAYCAERWQLPRVRAYQLMESARVIKALGAPEGLRNEAQARMLASLEPERAKEVWERVETRVAETGMPVTANLIRQVREELTAPATPPDVPAVQTATDRLIQDMVRLANTFQRWKGSNPKRNEVRAVDAAVKRLVAQLA